jgi:uncharacterized protein involved in oxidation of intracellular sulfur
MELVKGKVSDKDEEGLCASVEKRSKLFFQKLQHCICYHTFKKMKIGIIIETKEFEKAWNAFRFAITAKKLGNEVKVFLMGEAVECEGLTHSKYNVDEQLKMFSNNGGEILACGTCLKSRQLDSSDTCPISTMVDCVNMVLWADKTVTF